MAPSAHLQKDLYSAMHADSELRSLPIYSFSLAMLTGVTANGCSSDTAADIAAIGDLTSAADAENLHEYPYRGALAWPLAACAS